MRHQLARVRGRLRRIVHPPRVKGRVPRPFPGGLVMDEDEEKAAVEVVREVIGSKRLFRGGGAPDPRVPAAPGDAALLEMLSARHEFKSHTVAGWQPALGFSAACDGIAQWLHDSGYRLVGGS